MLLYSYAKVNLTLDVLAKRPQDGYHNVRSIMLPVGLADRMSLEEADGLEVTCDPPVQGTAEANLAYRAAALLRQETGCRRGARIAIAKRIPVAGGMAGGSTNAAAALVGLNQLWETGLSKAELIDLAIRLGSDVPFFIESKPARVEGIGERLTPVSSHPLWLVVATPPVAKCTGNVYRLFDELPQVARRPDTAAMEAALAAGDLPVIAQSLGNVFEQVMLPLHPPIQQLKSAMLAGGALGALMSGAGPTVFGLVETEEAGRRLLQAIAGMAQSAHLVQTIA